MGLRTLVLSCRNDWCTPHALHDGIHHAERDEYVVASGRKNLLDHLAHARSVVDVSPKDETRTACSLCCKDLVDSCQMYVDTTTFGWIFSVEPVLMFAAEQLHQRHPRMNAKSRVDACQIRTHS